MSDFWNEFDEAYRLFSQYCDTNDWHRILESIAGAVAATKPASGSALTVLDVGCGNAVATQTICEQVFAATGWFPQLGVVEPSIIARERLYGHLLVSSTGGPMELAAKSIEAIPANRQFDAIVFVHSTYYVAHLADQLQVLVDVHLAPSGAVIVLALPRYSPFFLGLPPLPHCADEVHMILSRMGLRVESYQLRSRFRLPTQVSAVQWEHLMRFMAPHVSDLTSFQALVKQFLCKARVADFGDHLLVGRRTAS
jgi:SAM-dependent methyltransferase